MTLQRHTIASILVAIVATSTIAVASPWRDEGEQARSVFMGSRPPGRKSGGRRAPRTRRPIGLGYTLYRAGDNQSPVRVDSTQTFYRDDRVRLVFEPSADGYLYVFNSTNGGEPRMVYPDPRLDGGDNRVRAHVLYQLPSSAEPDERLRWFVFYGTPGTERLYVVVSRSPLKNVPRSSQLVAMCRSQQGGCAVRPDAATWAGLMATLDQPVRENRATAFGQPISVLESDAIAREFGLPPEAPGPSVVRVCASSAASVLVTAIDLAHETR